MGSSKGFAKVLAIVMAIALAAVVAAPGVAGASAPRAASPEAKQACSKLKDKIKGKKGKAKAKAKAKYKKCLEEYDEANPPGDDGGGTTDPGGGTTDPGGGTTDPGGGSTQCTSLENCPHLTPNDAAGQQAMGNQIILERAEFASVTAEYYRLFFYSGGIFKGFAVDWSQASGEICRGNAANGQWSFKDGYTYTLNGGGVLVVLNVTANGQSGTEVLDFRNGSSSVYVGPNAIRFDNNPHAQDNC